AEGTPAGRRSYRRRRGLRRVHEHPTRVRWSEGECRRITRGIRDGSTVQGDRRGRSNAVTIIVPAHDGVTEDQRSRTAAGHVARAWRRRTDREGDRRGPARGGDGDVLAEGDREVQVLPDSVGTVGRTRHAADRGRGIIQDEADGGTREGIAHLVGRR